MINIKDNLLMKLKDIVLLIAGICGILSGIFGLVMASSKIVFKVGEIDERSMRHISKYETSVDSNTKSLAVIEQYLKEIANNQSRIMKKMGLNGK